MTFSDFIIDNYCAPMALRFGFLMLHFGSFCAPNSLVLSPNKADSEKIYTFGQLKCFSVCWGARSK